MPFRRDDAYIPLTPRPPRRIMSRMKTRLPTIATWRYAGQGHGRAWWR
ncbi:MAG: hypothetical protein AVDCRST_MAG91-1204 [uncultured Sphingomonadaceae bacterium]|uniref:Uncharacterized protein n=1 Tax=uncultured Sphingomonadaceae bacterium TaxID=169976 RepID=A0A6J4SRV7_9SPHN|nr:MAG: hypothetical protein AVDCRST_MAG91-1204 [uncultured Sphingomonadaceae bacterium]